MGKRRAVLILLLLLAFNAMAHAASPLILGESHVLHSRVQNLDRGYRVALPPDYAWSPDTRYPVMYVLDAQDQFAHVASTVAFMAASGEMPQTIVVGVDSGNRIHDYTQSDWSEAWVGGGGAAQFQAFLDKELIPEVASRWRTNGFRTLMGHSASAQFVLHELATAPNAFNAWFVFSPSLDWDHGLPRRELARAFAGMKSQSGFVYFAYSNDFGGALADDLALADTLMSAAPAGLRRQVQAMPGETHVGMTLQATIDALHALYTNYRYDPGDLDVGLEAVQTHYKALSKMLGTDIAVPEETLNGLGYALLQQGKAQEAAGVFQRAVNMHPLSANAHDSLSDAYARAGDLARSAEESQKAAALARKYHHPELKSFEHKAETRTAEAAAKGR